MYLGRNNAFRRGAILGVIALLLACGLPHVHGTAVQEVHATLDGSRQEFPFLAAGGHDGIHEVCLERYVKPVPTDPIPSADTTVDVAPPPPRLGRDSSIPSSTLVLMYPAGNVPGTLFQQGVLLLI